MAGILYRTFCLFATFLTLSWQMLHEPKVPTAIQHKNLLFTDTTPGRQIFVAITIDELSVYRNQGMDSYQLIDNTPICDVSSLFLTESVKHLQNGLVQPTYNILVGCKNGFFKVFEIPLSRDKLINTFSQNLERTILNVLCGDSSFPYYVVYVEGKIALFNRQNYEKMLEVPIAGPISRMIYNDIQGVVLISDSQSQIKIQITPSKTLQIKRKSLIIQKQMIETPSRRLLVNQTCGNNITQQVNNQQCDDGNVVDNDGCSSTCKNQTCGDGIWNNRQVEECDNGGDTPDCVNCKLTCGNGVIDSGQQCDPGDTSNGTNSSECTDNCTRVAKSTYRTALGVGLGVGFLGLVGVVVGTSVAPAGAGVASSLIGINPAGQIGSALPTGAISQGAKILQPL